ncbi:inorganic phosphate transporter [Arcobacter sp. FWKO B]|uniref:inorganic phosphate transporter n=1 Tax=Arcobacter sp. FWKO B TaxID=2593672 RepID=UPI0018A41402|nr:inorganic phosphate transporter [Arcobacter sp. FWKO B]QOG12308.1 inorganic phosphate transporter [Arcobacter sp. FWKO B]
MDIQTIGKISKETKKVQTEFSKFSLALLFIAVVFIWTFATHGTNDNNIFLIVGAVFGAYMAMNIGANDVANNVGPAVGSKAMTLFTAIILAAVCEAAGAFIAGGEVVKTIKNGIIDPSYISDPNIYIWAMAAALLSAAIWLNFATSIGAPVSTTHSIVGGVMGAGIAAAGFAIVAWGTVGKIVLSWIVSPVLGGIVAAGFLYFIKKKIIYKKDIIGSGQKFVPILIAIMAWAFITYLMLKGVNQIVKVNFITASLVGLGLATFIYVYVKKIIIKKSDHLANDRSSINTLFNIPLIFAAALLSFAHGANDVANAIGPLAAINDAVLHGDIRGAVAIPFWVMAVGAIGIAIGLLLYGPKLIKTVGSEITELDQIRAYCIAMAAALTVIIASQLGIPVSSTHIAIGAVFGVGFLREWLNATEKNYLIEAREKFKKDKKELQEYNEQLNRLIAIENKSKEDYELIVALHKAIDDKEDLVKSDKKEFKSAKNVQLVKRDAVKKIIAAWLITVPAASLLSAGIFFMIKGIMM